MMNLGKKVSFGFSAVVAGQKTSGNNEPQLIVNSTAGKFTITAPVSKAMGIAVGENIQFVHNIAEIEKAIVEGHDDIKAVADELGADLTSREGQLTVVEALTQWGLVKGQPMTDSKGKQVMVSARLTEEEKRAFINENAASILEANRNALIERVGNPDATDEELKDALTVDDATPTEDKYLGCKAASKLVGTGNMVSFTDTNVWMKLKNDLDDKESKNRYFNVHLDSPVTFAMNNGHEDVNVTAYPISFDKDVDPIVRGANSDEE